jgi:HK97 family phage major capsid protein
MPNKKIVERKIRTTMLRRIAYFDRGSLDMDARTVELAFSSEEPVDRWFGQEILDHKKSSVRMNRLRDTGPFLLHHDSREHIGTVDTAKIDTKDRMGRAVMRVGKGADRDAILQDIEDGIRKCVSVGYRIHRAKLEESGEDSPDVYRATDWEPYEVSLVSMPADTTVGVGREAREWHSGDEGEFDTIIVEIEKKEAVMPPETQEQKEAREAAELAAKTPAPTPTPKVDKVDTDKVLGAERHRIKVITEVGAKYGQVQLATKCVAEGDTLAEFNAKLLDTMPGAVRKEAETSGPEDLNIGLTTKEQKRFSFLRLIRAQKFGPKDPKFIEAAAFELDCSRAAAEKYETQPQGWLVPTDVLLFGDRDRTKDWRAVKAFERLLIEQRVLTQAGAGASTIAEDLLAGSFIDLLRNRSILMALGTTVLDGLIGDVAIPRLTGAGTAFWLATDETDITESTQTLDQVTLTPRNVGAFSVYTRQLLMQSSIAIEQLIRNDLATVLAIAIDLAGLYGTGASGQPTGVANTSGINAPGMAGTAPTWAEAVAFETSVATDNALLGTLAYCMDATMRGALKTTEKVSATAAFVWEPGNTVNGYRTEVSAQVTDGDLFFGNWADLLQGVWGGLDVLVDPYTLSARMNTRVIEMWTTDFAVRHPESFAMDNDT